MYVYYRYEAYVPGPTKNWTFSDKLKNRSY